MAQEQKYLRLLTVLKCLPEMFWAKNKFKETQGHVDWG